MPLVLLLSSIAGIACVANSPAGSAESPSSAPTDPCLSIQQAQLGPGVEVSFPARSAAEVLANAPKDPLMRHLMEDIAGVRPGPLADARVPRCRLDLLVLADPVFLRWHPQTTNGSWLVPIVFQRETLETAIVDVDPAGMGRLGSSRGGAIPIPTEAAARAAGALPGDAVVDAQLVLKALLGCGTLTPAWRIVRASGSAAYFALDVPNATPPGVLFEAKDIPSGVGGGRFGHASLGVAC
jgi:hypothetical protein